MSRLRRRYRGPVLTRATSLESELEGQPGVVAEPGVVAQPGVVAEPGLVTVGAVRPLGRGYVT